MIITLHYLSKFIYLKYSLNLLNPRLIKFFFKLFILCITCQSIFSNEKIQDKKVVICGVVKNGEAAFSQTKKDVKNIAALFGDYRIVIYENNSIDRTKHLYQSWALEDEKLKFISEDLDQKLINRISKLGSDSRIFFISKARNQLLKEISDSFYDDFEFVIMMDLDEFYFTNYMEIVNIVENPRYEWDAVFANGSYDILALRSKDFPFSPELLGVETWFKNVPTIRKNLESKLEERDWYEVDSAFGGLAIYKKSVFDGVNYSAFINQELASQYDSYIFQDNLKLYEKTAQNNLKKLKKKKKTNFICEHVVLHALIKINKQSKFFIDKNLLRLTRDHNHK
jgi:hypothetical protein